MGQSNAANIVKEFYGLRQRATQSLAGRFVDLDNLSTEDIQHLVHPLQPTQASLLATIAEDPR